MIKDSVDYYETHAEEFVAFTVNADAGKLYAEFEIYLKPDSRILDLGCGSGRNSKYFVGKGYDAVWVCAFLLHISRENQVDVFPRICRALRPEGVLHGSWKYGNQDRLESVRSLTFTIL